MTDPTTTLCSQHDPAGGGPMPEIADIRLASPFDVRRVHMSVREPSRRDELGRDAGLAAFVNFTPEGVNLGQFARDDVDDTALRIVMRRIRKVVEEAQPGPLAPRRAVRVGVGILAVVAALRWGWMVWGWRNLPGAPLTACLVALGVHYVAGLQAGVTERLRRRSTAAWLDQQSRQELRTDRANRHRDRNVAVISVAGTLIAVVLTAALTGMYHLY